MPLRDQSKTRATRAHGNQFFPECAWPKEKFISCCSVVTRSFFFFYKQTKLYGICCPFAISKKASLSEIRLNFLLVKRHQLILASWRAKFAVNCAVRCEKQQKLANCKIKWDFWCSLKCILTWWRSVSLLSIFFKQSMSERARRVSNVLEHFDLCQVILGCTLLSRSICCNTATRPSADWSKRSKAST